MSSTLTILGARPYWPADFTGAYALDVRTATAPQARASNDDGEIVDTEDSLSLRADGRARDVSSDDESPAPDAVPR